MRVFSITADNKVVLAASEQAVGDCFRSREELGTLTEPWPAARLVEVWNLLPGVKPVRRFTDRATAVRRIWEAVEVLAAAGERGSARGTQRPSSRMKANKTQRRATARKGTKTEKILAMLRRPSGATLAALMRATQWQAHSVRGFLSGQLGKKMGIQVKSSRQDGERVYAIQS
jgi:hypothetical protein